MDTAFKYVASHGLCTEAAYPYKAVQGSCQSSCTVAVKTSSFKDVPQNSESALQTAVAAQPVSVAIEADTSAFQLYSSGVLSGTACGSNLDHGVLAVGYGTLNGVDYWKVKNSWGSSWGDNGFVLIQRNSGITGGVCGIAKMASYPVA